MRKYYAPKGGLPAQSAVSQDRSIFTTAYAYISKNAQTDIVTQRLPRFNKERVWVLARPMTGFAETFSQYIVELACEGGSNEAEKDPRVEAALFVLEGKLRLTMDGLNYELRAGSFVYIPAGMKWGIFNHDSERAVFTWIRKRYRQAEDGLLMPPPIVTHDDEINAPAMPLSDGKWATTRFMDPLDIRYDMHITIVNFEPGGLIPFDETHVMEHGLYVLEGKADYRINQDWIPVEAGDFIWLRGFCPQSCIARGDGPFRYLLYKDMHRHAKLEL